MSPHLASVQTPSRSTCPRSVDDFFCFLFRLPSLAHEVVAPTTPTTRYTATTFTELFLLYPLGLLEPHCGALDKGVTCLPYRDHLVNTHTHAAYRHRSTLLCWWHLFVQRIVANLYMTCFLLDERHSFVQNRFASGRFSFPCRRLSHPPSFLFIESQHPHHQITGIQAGDL